MATLDLRPKIGSIMDRLLRLGMVYDHEIENDDSTFTQYWMDYSKSLRAEYVKPTETEATFTDMDTRISKTVSAEELKSISSVITWRSKYGAPGEDVTLSVTNTGTEPVTIDANAAFTARRIA